MELGRVLKPLKEFCERLFFVRGLPGWVTSVDDEQPFATVTFFDNVDAKLFDEIEVKDPNAPPPKDGSPPPVEPVGSLAVAHVTRS